MDDRERRLFWKGDIRVIGLRVEASLWIDRPHTPGADEVVFGVAELCNLHSGMSREYLLKICEDELAPEAIEDAREHLDALAHALARWRVPF